MTTSRWTSLLGITMKCQHSQKRWHLTYTTFMYEFDMILSQSIEMYRISCICFQENSIMKSGAKNIVEDIFKVKQNEFIFISAIKACPCLFLLAQNSCLVTQKSNQHVHRCMQLTTLIQMRLFQDVYIIA